MEKLVSIIITTHNRCGLLRRAIEASLQQTYKNIEIVVVDDASTDETKKICEEYPVKYVYISKEKSQGGNYARNIGVSLSSGIYCAFLDDDDYWSPEKISEQVSLIELKKCDFVSCEMVLECVSADGNVTYKRKKYNKRYEGNISKKILFSIPTTTSALLVKRKALEVNRWDEKLKYWQDYDLMIRLSQSSFHYYVNKPLLYYRIDESDNNRLTNKYFDWLDNLAVFQKKHFFLYKKLNRLERLIAKTLVWRDAAKRCKVCGLKVYYYKYLLLCALFYSPYFVYDRLLNFVFKRHSV